MRRARWLLALWLAAGCEAAQLPAAGRCVAVAGEATPTAAQVCARLGALGCLLPDCTQAYGIYQSRTSPEEFNRLTSCYSNATTCTQVDECERACGADGGAVSVGPVRDASADTGVDASTDAGAEVGTSDAGGEEAGGSDVGASDAGSSDAGGDAAD